MSELPPNLGSDDVDDQYRRASALDASRPSESVRRAVLAHAAQFADEHAAKSMAAQEGVAANDAMPGRRAAPPRTTNRSWRRPAIFGTLAAAALGGLLIAPQFLTPRAPGTATLSKSEAPRFGTDAAPAPPARAQDKSAGGALARDRQNLSEERRMYEARRQSAAHFVPEPETATTAITSSADMTASAPKAASAPAGAQSAAPRITGFPQAAALSQRAAPQPAAPQPAESPTAASLIAKHLDEPPAALRRAAEAGDVGDLQGLLDRHPEVDGRDASGRTALMLATLHGRRAAVDALLKAGADPNAADASGMTPLQAAAAGHQPEIEAALRRAGAR